MSTINFSVHRNPQKDAQGNDTYQVRHETYTTVTTEQLLDHLKHHNIIRPEHLISALTVLADEIIEQLTMNRRLHLGGLGTFFLKLGFREREDENGQPVKPHFTDPRDITGNDVDIRTIGFMPDNEFLSRLREHGYHFENYTGRGQVGHSEDITAKEMEDSLRLFLQTHDYVTRRQIMQGLHLTKYMACKWLKTLTTGDKPLLYGEYVGNTIVYRLCHPATT